MKSWIFLPFALLLGWGLGSWIPTAELHAVRSELETVRKALKTNRSSSTTSLNGVIHMLGLESGKPEAVSTPSVANGKVQNASSQPHSTDEANAHDTSEELAPAVTAGETEAKEDEKLADNERGRSMARNIEQAIEVWNARVGIARATFVSNAALSQEEASHFDVLVDAMNIRLAHSIEQFAESASTGKDLGEADGVRLLRDLTTTMALTYDEMDASLPEEWKSSAGTSFSLTDFVDPAVALPLTEVEGSLNARTFPGRRRR